MVPIMIPVIRLDESVCPGRAEGMALAGTEERRFAGRDLIHELLDTSPGLTRNFVSAMRKRSFPILEQSGKVVAVIQGHHHAGTIVFGMESTIYNEGMIEGSLPENNSFAVLR